MTARERILAALSDGRLWRMSELCAVAGCHRVQVTRALQAGDAAEFGRGVVALPRVVGALMPRREHAELAMRFPGGVLCLAGAARHWGLSEVVGDQVLVHAGAASVSAQVAATVVRTRNPSLLELGVVSEELAPGVVFRVTDRERTLCDLFTDRHQDGEVRRKALSAYLDENGRTRDGIAPLAAMERALRRACGGREYCRDLRAALTAVDLEAERPGVVPLPVRVPAAPENVDVQRPR